MNLGELLKAISLDAAAAGSVAVSGVTADSRQVREGYVYVGLRGARYDGREFVPDAVSRGAAACVVEGEVAVPREARVPIFSVPDGRRAVGLLASAFHGHPSSKLRVIGTTGTNGKTTVSYLVRDIFKAADLAPGLIGTITYDIGERSIPASRTTPEAAELQGLLAQMVATSCRSAILEVSSHALAQHRVAGIDFDVGVFTNLTGDHLDYHHDMEHYFEAKARLFHQLGTGDKQAYAVINTDDPFGQRLASNRFAAETVTYGMGPHADVRAENVEMNAQGSRFTLSTPWGQAEIETSLMGRFNVSNVTAALAIAGVMGVDMATATAALKHASGAPGRLEEIPTGQPFHVFVDYAHTDDALSNVLHTLREVTQGRLIVVFGCGGDRDRSKRPLMGRIAEVGADLAIVTSDNPRSEDPSDIIAEIISGVHNRNCVQVEADRRAAIHQAIGMAQPGDMVLIAGKGHEHFQETGSRTIPFDDRQVTQDALQQL